MDEDFEDWDMQELKDRVELIQEFDRLTDDIVAEAVYFAEHYRIEDEEYYEPKTRKILVPA